MKRIIPVYIFQQVNVLLVSLYLLKFLCIGELTILQVLYGASLFSFLWMYGNLLDSLIVSEYQMEPNLWEVSHD
ncbi:putative metal-dependent membrane protease [Streptococcus pneumoniae]|nr:putative metal-dependent membrane protease [Streptococcus pneumoniae]